MRRINRLKFWLTVSLLAIMVLCWSYFVRTSPDAGPEFTDAPATPREASSRSDASLPTLTGTAFQTQASTLAPATDEWPSEAFADAALQVLNAGQSAFSQDGSMTPFLRELLAPSFHVSVTSREPEQVYASPTITVWRASNDQASRSVTDDSAETVFLHGFVSAGAAATDRQLAFKILDVEVQGPRASTTIRVEASWSDSQRSYQQTSLWRCDWDSRRDDPPKIVSAEMQSMELVQRRGSPWFSDCTESVVGQTAAFQRQLQYGLQYWLARIETAHGMNYFSRHGLAVADVNGDGLDDVYICQPGGLPNVLFVQNPDGSASDQSRAYQLDLLDRTAGALFVDLDNDGDQDAALSTIVGVQIFENIDRKRFRHRQSVSLADTDLHGLSSVDFDDDGDLDLYVTVDYASQASRARQGLPAFVYHNANDGGANRLLRNELRPGQSATWEFRDVTEAAGLGVHNQRHSLAAAWEDYDNDGDQDLYVANDYGANCLYRNDGGRFTDVASDAGVIDFGSGMSVTWGDYDRDGHVDLYVGNMFSSAGSRITTQQEFLPRISEAGRDVYRRFAKGNSLFRNNADGTFRETGREALVEMGRWAWSSLFADVNNDGWQDLLVANGYITTPDPGDL